MVMNACFACAWDIHIGVGSENKPMLILLILANIAAIAAYQTYMREDITFTHELFQKKGLKWNFMPAAFLSYDWQHDTETKSSSSGNAVSSVGTEYAEKICISSLSSYCRESRSMCHIPTCPGLISKWLKKITTLSCIIAQCTLASGTKIWIFRTKALPWGNIDPMCFPNET